MLKDAPPHLAGLLDNLAEVDQLLNIHRVLTGTGPGRRHDVEVLNKSAIVLVVACWEAFVEDLASAGLDYMVKTAKDHTVFPSAVLDRVASKNIGPSAWNLAGDGWKVALRNNLTGVLAKTTGTLNTPKTAQVDELFLKTLGYPRLSVCWKWRGRSAAQVRSALDQLVSLRGSIAHRVQHSRSVRKSDVREAIDLVSRMAAKSNNEVSKFIHAQLGSFPWDGVSYKGTA